MFGKCTSLSFLRVRYVMGWLLPGVCLAALSGAGCRSSAPEQPESARYASMVIHGNTPGQIATVTQEVFRGDGFAVAQSGPSKLVFEKQGSRFNELAYGSWVGDTPIWVRARVSIVPAGEAAFRVECQAYYIWDKAGPAEEELPSRPRSAHFKKLLQEVAHRLTRQTANPK